LEGAVPFDDRVERAASTRVPGWRPDGQYIEREAAVLGEGGRRINVDTQPPVTKGTTRQSASAGWSARGGFIGGVIGACT
jgi:hypothetical protein